jgi:hypothetical protein
VPPLQTDERLRLDPKRFPFYRHSQAAFFLAYEGTRPTGRLPCWITVANEFHQ